MKLHGHYVRGSRLSTHARARAPYGFQQRGATWLRADDDAETRERVACRFKRSQDFNGVFNVIGQRQSAGSDEPVRLDSQWVVRPHAADPQGERIAPDPGEHSRGTGPLQRPAADGSAR